MKNGGTGLIGNLTATLQTGRKHFDYRIAIPFKGLNGLTKKLSPELSAKIKIQQNNQLEKKLVFLFPGGGAQHTNMGIGLYREEPVFREVIDQCLNILKEKHELDLRSVLFPDHLRNEPILNPLHAITLLFSAEYATAQLLLSWGFEPSEMIGHSLGEYTAACIAGVFSLEDALALVTLRGRLFQTLDEGAMLSVPLPPQQVEVYMDEDLSFAAINKPDHCVVSGSVEAIDRIKQKLNAEEIHSTRLHIKVAAHSHMITPILEEFGQLLQGINFGNPKIPIISNLSGTWVTADEIQTVQYWQNHLRQTVRFSDGIETILQLPNRILLEVGPGQTLSTFARQHPAKQSGQSILAALKHPKETEEDALFLLKTIGKLYGEGYPIDWLAFNQNHPFQRISLPTYPFEKKSYWLEPKAMPFNDLNEKTLELNTEQEVQSAPPNATPKMDRKTLILEKITQLFHDMSGIPLDDLHVDATFLELGFDSLFLTQATSKIKKTLKVKLSFRQLFEEAPTMEDLAVYVDQQLAPEVFQEELNQVNAALAPPTPPAANLNSTNISTSISPLNAPIPSLPKLDPSQMGAMETLFHRQLQIMEQQLAILNGGQSQATNQSQVQSPTNIERSQQKINRKTSKQPEKTKPQAYRIRQ